MAFALLSIPVGARVAKDAKELIETRKSKVGNTADLSAQAEQLQKIALGSEESVVDMYLCYKNWHYVFFLEPFFCLWYEVISYIVTVMMGIVSAY